MCVKTGESINGCMDMKRQGEGERRDNKMQSAPLPTILATAAIQRMFLLLLCVDNVQVLVVGAIFILPSLPVPFRANTPPVTVTTTTSTTRFHTVSLQRVASCNKRYSRDIRKSPVLHTSCHSRLGWRVIVDTE